MGLIWPWVARSTLEAEVSRRVAQEARLDRLAERNEALQRDLLAMKREGYERQPDLPAPEPPTPLPLPIVEALDSLGLGPREYGREALRVSEWLGKGMDTREVVRRLYEGEG